MSVRADVNLAKGAIGLSAARFVPTDASSYVMGFRLGTQVHADKESYTTRVGHGLSVFGGSSWQTRGSSENEIEYDLRFSSLNLNCGREMSRAAVGFFGSFADGRVYTSTVLSPGREESSNS